MKNVVLGTIVAGVICLAVAMAETVLGVRLLRVEPIKLILLATAVETFAVALAAYCRVFGSDAH